MEICVAILAYTQSKKRKAKIKQLYMKLNHLAALLLAMCVNFIQAQNYPSYGLEIPVTINSLATDAMEPSISIDGNTIFYNSLNDGVTTSLYYATRVNDSVFNFSGLLSGASETVSPRMDAVASSDVANNFYWMSLRDFPTEYDNYFHGTFNGTDVTNIGRVHGDLYIYSVGWLIMDAAINYDGSTLYYCNAYFGPNYNSCNGIPCEAQLGVAQKVNDSTFAKLTNSDNILQSVNDTNYIVYAPFISSDGLELYYTRALHNGTQTEICVAVRTNTVANFSVPGIIYASPLIPEAPTLTSDKSKMYYHRKVGNTYKLFMRNREVTTAVDEADKPEIAVYPNPVINEVLIKNTELNQLFDIELYSITGQLLLHKQAESAINIEHLEAGIYVLKVKQKDNYIVRRIIKQ